MKAYGEVEVWLNSFLTSSSDEAERLALCSDRFTLGTLWIWDWMGQRTDLYRVTGRFIFSILCQANIRRMNIKRSLDSKQRFFVWKGRWRASMVSVHLFTHTPNFTHRSIFDAKCWTLTLIDGHLTLRCARYHLCQSTDRKRG